MESVLVGVDRSEGSRRAVKFALERARLNSWRMTIVHVVNWSPYAFHTHQENEERPLTRKAEIEFAQKEVVDPIVSWAKSQDPSDDVEVDWEIHHGRPSEVLADLADGHHDIIVVGRTGDSGLRHSIFGSTSNRLVQHSPVPVVVVP